jgi:hypothetical protein
VEPLQSFSFWNCWEKQNKTKTKNLFFYVPGIKGYLNLICEWWKPIISEQNPWGRPEPSCTRQDTSSYTSLLLPPKFGYENLCVIYIHF